MSKQLLRQVGEFLFGAEWQAPLAREVDVGERSMRRWAAGTENVPAGVWRDISFRLESRRGDLQHLMAEVKRANDTETELKAEWLDFAKRLRPVGMGIFGASSVKITEQGAADIRIVGLMLLARTLSNLKAAIALTEGGLIVEAKVIGRCCFENSYWVGALVKEGDKFRASMVQHEMKHKRMRAQTIFSTTGGFEGEIGDKLRQWMRDHKEYEDSPTLDPRAVCQRAENASYMFYQHLSWDAHPSIETLNRYYEEPDADGASGIDVDPVVRDAEVIEMLNLMCLAVIGVFLGVGDLLGQDNVPAGTMAAEFKALTERTGQDELVLGDEAPLHRRQSAGLIG